MTCDKCFAAAPAEDSQASPAPLERGEPGGSLAREYERRKSNREARTREAHPHIGDLLLKLGEAPQHETSFKTGDRGEKAVASSLEQRTSGSPVLLLHNRRMPGGRGDIDHIAITPTGVFVIDAKGIKGKVRVARPLFGAEKLIVKGRDRTKLIDGLDRQVAAVKGTLEAGGHPGLSVQGVLCFTQADLPLLGTVKIRGHLLLYRKALAKRLRREGSLELEAIEAAARALAEALPPA